MRRKRPKEAVRVAAEAGFSVEKADVELEKDPESEQFASVRSVTVYVAGSEAGMEAAEQENQSSMIEIEKIPRLKFPLEQEQKQGRTRRRAGSFMDEWGKDLGASAAAGIVLSGGGGSCGSQDGTLTRNGSNEMKNG